MNKSTHEVSRAELTSEFAPNSTTIGTRGFGIIRHFNPHLASSDAFQKLGTLDSVEGLNTVQKLIPRELTESPPNTYSGNFGTADFPLHTDLAHWAIPPRYIALRCICGSPEVATRLFDGRRLLSKLGKDALRMALVQPRRPMQNGKQLLRLLERPESDGPYLIRWDNIFLKPATGLAADVFAKVKLILSKIRPLEVVLLDPGDTLIIDNWRFLHGRSATTESSGTRHVDRAYLKELYDYQYA
ncbi:MAG: hypothetical protein ABJC13_01210 [Acidobacteriota bacterium]